MTGTIINTIAVIVGGTLGSLLGARLPDKVRQIVIQGVGLVVIVVGVQMALKTQNILIVLGSILVGGIIGEWWRIDERLESLGRKAEEKASRFPFLTRGDFTKGFVTASLVFCVGPMTVVGSLQEGISGDASLLIMKSVLDGFTSMAFAASLGMGVTFSAIVVLVVQGGLTLSAGALGGLLSDEMVLEMTAAGGVLLIGISLMMLEIKRIRVANLLPALAIAPLLVPLWSWIQTLLNN